MQAPPLLSEQQRTYLDRFLEFCPRAAELRSLALQFRAMLRWRRPAKLNRWLNAARSSGFPFVADYARRLTRDLDAVRLSISVPWSNGPIEGQINRLKVIKRQMYGRAGFDLLKVRVMPFVEPPSSTEIA